MLRASHHPFWVKFFDWYLRTIIKKDFQAFNLYHDLKIERDKPLLVLANHFSWWDGFFQVYANQLLYKKKFHVMMLEEELRKRKIISKAGCYSVTKGSRGIIESLNYTLELLEDPANMVLLFPQGRIESQGMNTIHFESGTGRIIERMGDVQLVMAVAMTEYYNRRKPAVELWLRPSPEREFPALAQEYGAFYQKCREALRRAAPLGEQERQQVLQGVVREPVRNNR